LNRMMSEMMITAIRISFRNGVFMAFRRIYALITPVNTFILQKKHLK
jgi:hypothetical protein